MIELRPASCADLGALWETRTRAVAHSCAAHYTGAVLNAWLTAAMPDSLRELVSKGGAIAAEEAGRMLGYAVLDADSGEVTAVFVEPAAQGRGIGSMLLDAVQDAARAAGVKRLFLSASLNGVPFYGRAGFVALREELYPHRSGVGIPSVYMEKCLDPLSQRPAAPGASTSPGS